MLIDAGVSVRVDQIRRPMITSRELARMIAVECSRGVTANPSIFEKAILGSSEYDKDLEAIARAGLDAGALYERLAIRDVQLAADGLADVHRRSNSHDGFVSLAVRPEIRVLLVRFGPRSAFSSCVT